jgi:DHA1 family tetracycline resistance protein-like MFS transporter
LGAISPRLPFWAAAGMSLLNVAWGLFVLPESLPRDRRVPFSWRSANPLGALKLLSSHPMLAGLARSFFLINLAHVVFPSITVLYLHYRYGWEAQQVGAVLAGTGISSLLVQVFLIKRAVKLLKERLAMVVGLTFGAIGFALYGLAASGTVFWFAIPIMALWGIATPSLQAVMTGLVSPTEQGRLQGALASLTGLASLIGPTLFTQLFAASISVPAANWHTLPGAPFFLSSALVISAMIMAWRATRSMAPSPAATAV